MKKDAKVSNLELANISKSIHLQYQHEMKGGKGMTYDFSKSLRENPLLTTKLMYDYFKLWLD